MPGPDDGDHVCPPSEHRRDDACLLVALRETAFQGKEYDQFVYRITKYGLGVLWKVIQDGTVWAKLEKMDRPRIRPDYWCQRDKEELVNDSVHDGYLDFFRKIIAGGGWDPSGASLNTLFVRYCLSRFADRYQAWQRSSSSGPGQPVSLCDPDDQELPHVPSAERVALAKQEVADLSAEQFAQGAGYTHKEIGQLRGITERAVEGRLYRARLRRLEDDERRA
jgi:DNA-directed RNA polymerase specialized sigma24 family protein